MAEQWFLWRDQQQYGPYAWEDLLAYARAGQVAASDMLWSASTGAWVRADQVPGLLAAAPIAPASAPRPTPRKRSLVGPLLGLAALLMLIGGGYWAWRQRSPTVPKPGASTSATPTPKGGAVGPAAAALDESFWSAPEIEAAIAAMDRGDWRDDPDLAAEQTAIAQTLQGFGQAMQKSDLDAAVGYILPERRAAYRELFAANPEGMPSFGELLGRAEMSFLSQHGATTPYRRIAEYAVTLDGFTFYILFLKTEQGWLFYDF